MGICVCAEVCGRGMWAGCVGGVCVGGVCVGGYMWAGAAARVGGWPGATTKELTLLFCAVQTNSFP